ncbi:unnamed protein product [Urochloa humidicola]
MGFVRRLLEHHRPSLAVVAAAILVFELVVGHGGSKVRLNQIKAPLSPPFTLSIHLLCRHQHLALCFLRHAPHKRRTTTSRKPTDVQIHHAPLTPVTPPPSSLPTTITTTTSTSTFAFFILSGLAAVGPLRRQRTPPESHLRCVWTLVTSSSILFSERWPSIWAPLGLNIIYGGCWPLAIMTRWLMCYCAACFLDTPPVGSFKMDKGTSYNNSIPCVLFDSKYGSGNALLKVRVDLRPRSMLVLRFNIDKSRAIFLSPVKHMQYLRLKIPNSR